MSNRTRNVKATHIQVRTCFINLFYFSIYIKKADKICRLIANENLISPDLQDQRISKILHKAAERNIPIEYRSNFYLFNLSNGRPHQVNFLMFLLLLSCILFITRQYFLGCVSKSWSFYTFDYFQQTFA